MVALIWWKPHLSFSRLITAGYATTPHIPSQPFTSEVLSRQLLFLASVWEAQTQTGYSLTCSFLFQLFRQLSRVQHTTHTHLSLWFSSRSCVGWWLLWFCLTHPLYALFQKTFVWIYCELCFNCVFSAFFKAAFVFLWLTLRETARTIIQSH